MLREHEAHAVALGRIEDAHRVKVGRVFVELQNEVEVGDRLRRCLLQRREVFADKAVRRKLPRAHRHGLDAGRHKPRQYLEEIL